MKFAKLILTLFVVALVSMSLQAQVSGTVHGFGGDAWNSATSNEICGPCHTPHNAVNNTSIPLFSHTATAGPITPYPGGGSMQSAPGAVAGISLACLGCHDGTVALDAFVGGLSTGGLMAATKASADIGQDMSLNHPISITYDNPLSVLDNELYDPEATLSGLGLNIDDDMLFGAGLDQLECSSCHDAHGGVAGTKLLVKTNVNSVLCLTCHNK